MWQEVLRKPLRLPHNSLSCGSLPDWAQGVQKMDSGAGLLGSSALAAPSWGVSSEDGQLLRGRQSEWVTG